MVTKQSPKVWIIVGIIVFIICIIILAKAHIIGCKTEIKYKTERYKETVGYKNCDYDEDCTCIHKSWAGLGACDSCRCWKTKSVPYSAEECWFD